MSGSGRKIGSGGVEGTLIVRAPPAVAGARTKGILTVMSGLQTGRVLSIPEGGTATLGRSPDCTMTFSDASVSSRHANVAHVAGRFVFADMNSTNGSFVNDARLQAPAQLNDGDRIQLGMETRLRFALVSEQEETSLRQAYEAALRDVLTGTYNRRHMDERIEAEIAYAARHGSPLAVVMLDVDFFKKVNDTYGHQGGDAVLRSMGSLLLANVRSEDIVARYGGEEFTVVLRGITVQHAAIFAERVRAVVAGTPVRHEAHQIRVTSSFGVASLLCCGTKMTSEALLGVADARLYQAKQGGRNRVVST